MSLFEGVIKKSGLDINRPFRKRFCIICWEKNEMQNKVSLRKSIFPSTRLVQAKKSPSYNSQSSNNCKHLVLIYYKQKEKKAGDYKGKFVLDNSDFREVSEGIRDYRNVICIRLSHLHNEKNGGRDLYLCLKTEEQKNCLLKVLHDNIEIILSEEEYIEDTTEYPTKFIPFDNDNPLLKKLESMRKKLRNQHENETFYIDASTNEFYFSAQEITNIFKCYKFIAAKL
ncbi:uncharacterized protein LOC101238858 isoform X4 [Hydra vulgaris]|uniref:Uncharacterized protein LOC101238858 isoform X4 n=1 Tax=Hydra vulgaris TaxID=6087 RepID=A0ABM4C2D9_HYDVU